MIDARLPALSASESRGRDAGQCPAVIEEDDERTARVPDTRVLSAVLVSGAEHLREDLQIDSPRVVPALALVILDDGDVHLLQQPRAIAIGQCGIRLPPARHDAVPALKRHSCWRQADRQHVVRVAGCFVQLQDCDVEAVRVRG